MWTLAACLGHWPLPRLSTRLPLLAGLAPQRCLQGQVLRYVCSSPSSFLSEAQLSLQSGGRKEGWGQSSGPRLQPGCTVRGQRSREAGAPSQQAFMRHYTPLLPCGGPAPLPLRCSHHPAPRSTQGGTQESHQLPPLSTGPVAPRASLDASLATSSSSSSSSSPSVKPPWLGP